MIRHLVTGGVTNSPQPQQQQQTVQIPTVNLTTPVVGTLPVSFILLTFLKFNLCCL